jgi:hypothetical protein
MFSTFLLNPVNGGIVEERGAAGTAFVVMETFYHQSVAQVTVFYDGYHLHFAALRAGERLRYRCFFSMK